MRTLPLNALRAFALTAGEGGVRAAARELRVTHSAVSRHLRELENWLGVALFERSAAPATLRLTPQGRRLADSTLAALRNIADATDAVRERRSPHALTLSCAPSFAARWLLPRLASLGQAHPHLELSVVVEQQIEDPRRSGCDVLIRMGRGPWRDVAAEPLMDDELYPVMSPGAWRQAGSPQRPQDLLGLRLLHDRDPDATWLLWRRSYGPAHLDVRKGPRFGSSDLVLRAAAQGLGVALARGRLAAHDVRTGTLLRPLQGLSVPLPAAYSMIRPPGRATNEPLLLLIAWLKREARRPD